MHAYCRIWFLRLWTLSSLLQWTIYFSGCDGDDDEHNQHYDHGEDERLRPRLKTALVVET